MKKFLSFLLLTLTAASQSTLAFAETATTMTAVAPTVSAPDYLTKDQQKLFNKAYPKLKSMVEKRTDIYRKSAIKSLEKAIKATKNEDQAVVLTEMIYQLEEIGLIKDFETKMSSVVFRDETKEGSYYDKATNTYKLNKIDTIMSLATSEDVAKNGDYGYVGGASHTNCRIKSISDLSVSSPYTIGIQYDYKIDPASIQEESYQSSDAYIEAMNNNKYLEATVNRSELFSSKGLVSISKPRFVKKWTSEFSYIELVKAPKEYNTYTSGVYVLSCSLVRG